MRTHSVPVRPLRRARAKALPAVAATCLTALAALGLAGPASAGVSLYGVQPATDNIVQIDPATGATLRAFAAPGNLTAGNTQIGLSGAEEGASLIYHNAQANSNAMYRIDPATGSLLSTESIFTSNGLSFQTGPGGEKYIFIQDGEFDIHRITGFNNSSQAFFWGPFNGSPGPRAAAGGDDQGREFSYYTDNMIRSFDPFTDGDAINTFAPPSTDVQGMAYDGATLYVSTTDGKLHGVDPVTGAVRTTVTIQGGALFGLGAIVTPPGAPTALSTDPASPADDNNPRVKGSAEANTTVKVYATSDCTGTPVVTGSAAGFASPGLAVAVADNSTTTFYATATNSAGTSPCSTASVTYQEDSTAPSAPSGLSTDPGSPSNDNSPRVKGTAEAGSTVSVYTTADCTGTPETTGSAAAFASPGLSVTVASDSVTTFRTTTTDRAGNASACSDPVTYREDSAAPTTTDDVPSAPRNAPPRVTLTATDPTGGSGVASTRYLIGVNPADPADPATKPLIYDPANKPTLNNGERIRYSSVDKVGNVEVARTSVAARVDPEIPKTPVVSGLSARERCVRGATLKTPTGDATGLAFSFSLSAKASVKYVIKRRNGSRGKSTCPVVAGRTPGRYTEVSKQDRDGTAGSNTTSLANTAKLGSINLVRVLRAGRTRVTLARIAQAKTLTPGTYVLYVTATDSFGQTSNVARIKFWVLTG